MSEDLIESTEALFSQHPQLADDTLVRERREWSKLISVACYVGLVACIGAVTIVVILIALPGVIEFSHKNILLGVLSPFYLATFVLLYKARDDSRSLIFISIFAIALSCLTIGFAAGQFIRHTP